jgi:hypothetical protein
MLVIKLTAEKIVSGSRQTASAEHTPPRRAPLSQNFDPRSGRPRHRKMLVAACHGNRESCEANLDDVRLEVAAEGHREAVRWWDPRGSRQRSRSAGWSKPASTGQETPMSRNMNPVIHFEMPANDMDRVQAFYKDVFGWRTQALGPGAGGFVLAFTTDSDETASPGRSASSTGASTRVAARTSTSR